MRRVVFFDSVGGAYVDCGRQRNTFAKLARTRVSRRVRDIWVDCAHSSVGEGGKKTALREISGAWTRRMVCQGPGASRGVGKLTWMDAKVGGLRWFHAAHRPSGLKSNALGHNAFWAGGWMCRGRVASPAQLGRGPDGSLRATGPEIAKRQLFARFRAGADSEAVSDA